MTDEMLTAEQVHILIAASGIGRRESGVRASRNEPPNGYRIALDKRAAERRDSEPFAAKWRRRLMTHK